MQCEVMCELLVCLKRISEPSFLLPLYLIIFEGYYRIQSYETKHDDSFCILKINENVKFTQL